jgi:pimeloyl-ACP methyl ester carboxylesterase
MKIREDFWKIPTKDGAAIYGVTNSGRGNKAVVIMAHCLAGSVNSYLLRSAVERFVPAGVDCLRLNFYSWEDEARRLRDCTIGTHAMDLASVIEAKAMKYDHIFVVGHSFGAVAAIKANHHAVTAYSLWDPSYDLPSINFAEGSRRVERDFLFDWGIELVIGRRMVRDCLKNYDRANCRQLSRDCLAPLQVITAAADIYGKRKESWQTYAVKGRRDFVAGADHNFTSLHSAEKLHDLTLKWFSKFRT